MMKEYFWHGFPCHVLIEPTYKPGTIRNCLIELNAGVVKGKKMVVPRRALRLRPLAFQRGGNNERTYFE